MLPRHFCPGLFYLAEGMIETQLLAEFSQPVPGNNRACVTHTAERERRLSDITEA